MRNSRIYGLRFAFHVDIGVRYTLSCRKTLYDMAILWGAPTYIGIVAMEIWHMQIPI